MDPKDQKGNETPKNPVPNVQSTKPVQTGVIAKPDPDQDSMKGSAEFEKALKEPDSKLTAAEAKAIEAALGDDAEDDDEADHDSAAAVLNVIGEIGDTGETFDAAKERFAQFFSEFKSSQTIITALVRDVPRDTPDEFIIWGASGHTLRMGHLRALVMGIR